MDIPDSIELFLPPLLHLEPEALDGGEVAVLPVKSLRFQELRIFRYQPVYNIYNKQQIAI